VIIFDCNGVLVDSEQLAATAAAHESSGSEFRSHPKLVSSLFPRTPAGGYVCRCGSGDPRELPAHFADTVAAATLDRLRVELRAMRTPRTR
jgi:beta-phosphoglucomutase-like phosphatase (HAD superfamily)